LERDDGLNTTAIFAVKASTERQRLSEGFMVWPTHVAVKIPMFLLSLQNRKFSTAAPFWHIEAIKIL
jgi:hypothetical protein